MKNSITRVYFSIFVIAVTLATSGCHQATRLTPEPAGFIDCFRLDREPLTAEQAGDCDTQPRVGNFHHTPDQPLLGQAVIASMPDERLSKLPLADCLWTAQSQFGNGDMVALYWEGKFILSGENQPQPELSALSACRFDPVDQRIPAQLAEDPDRGILGGVCLPSSPRFSGSYSLDRVKSSCDAGFYTVQTVLRMLEPRPYGECSSNVSGAVTFSPTATQSGHRFEDWYVSGDPQSSCAHADTERSVRLRPRGEVGNSLNPADFKFEVTAGGTQTLQPALMTVVDERTIARPLSLDGNGQLRWQAPVVAGATPGLQRWRENFSDQIRVDSVRVFSETLPGVPQYLDLDEAALNLLDPDGPPGIVANCTGAGDTISVSACGIQATPTYRVANLGRSDLTSLSDPLAWQVALPEIEDANYFIEFHLVSTYKTRQSAIMLSPASHDFGRVLTGTPAQRLIWIDNVGFGGFVVDEVTIDPSYGDPGAFTADLLDDPSWIPYPYYFEPTGESQEYETGVQFESDSISLVDYRMFETHETVALHAVDGWELEIEGEPVQFAGKIAVAMASQPSYNASSTIGLRVYPFKFPIYRNWNLPYQLAPGTDRSVMITVRPPYAGAFKGRLNVSGYPLHDPGARQTASVFLDASGLNGPLGYVMPSSAQFPYAADQSVEQRLIIVSHGHYPLSVGDIGVVESDDTAHSGEDQYFVLDGSLPSHTSIAPGDSEMITIRYQPHCFYIAPAEGEHRARLVIETDIGPFEVVLVGDPAAASAAGQCVM